MYPRTHFLGLPRELRDAIYSYYVTMPGGYIYSFSSGKLTGASNQAIDLALTLTCKLIASEMKGVALRHNTITFSTIYSRSTRLRAGQFEALIKGVLRVEIGMMVDAKSHITADVAGKVTKEYPQFAPILQHLGADHEFTRNFISSLPDGKQFWGETPSLCRQFFHHTLKLTSNSPGFDNIGPPTTLPGASSDPHAMLSIHHDPWEIPTEGGLKDTVKFLGSAFFRSALAYFDREDPSKWRFSAAAAAIRFLKSLSAIQRDQIRRVLLLEDHDSVAFPECHAQGLIPFCREHSSLRIERRVSLWQNVFQADPTWRTPEDRVKYNWAGLYATTVTKAVAPWIVEARALTSLGMPPGSFVLVLDGDPIPGLTADVWNIVLRDAAWQSALDEAYKRRLVAAPSYLQRRKHACYHFEDLPHALRDMVLGTTPLITCNFDPGDLVDVEQILQEHRGWDSYDWQEAWLQHSPTIFATAPPLPPWEDLLRENVLPRSY